MKKTSRGFRCLECSRTFAVPAGRIAFSRSFCRPLCKALFRAREAKDSSRKRKRREPMESFDYGPGWAAVSAACIARDRNICVRCANPAPKGVTWAVDHILPVRLASRWGMDKANAAANVWSLDPGCHGVKGGIDRLARRSDMLAWTRRMLAFVSGSPDMFERFAAAMRHFGLSEIVENVKGR